MPEVAPRTYIGSAPEHMGPLLVFRGPLSHTWLDVGAKILKRTQAEKIIVVTCNELAAVVVQNSGTGGDLVLQDSPGNVVSGFAAEIVQSDPGLTDKDQPTSASAATQLHLPQEGALACTKQWLTVPLSPILGSLLAPPTNSPNCRSQSCQCLTRMQAQG